MNQSARKAWPLVIVLLMLSLAALACDFPLVGGTTSLPTVNISSPATGTSVPVNQPVTIQVIASDPDGPGVFRIDLVVDSTTVESFQATAPQATLTTDFVYIPTVEGVPVSVTAVAFREDGVSGTSNAIALSVVAAGEAPPPPPPPPSPTPEEASSGGDESGGVSVIRVEAVAKVDVIIRRLSSPFCEQIGVWKAGETGYLLIRTTSPTEWWYQTDKLGPTQLGYVYQGQEQLNFTLNADDSILPREPEQGCLGCGDGICSEEIGEVCDECVEDCGVCPFCGDGSVNQSSEECDGGGCDTGFSCSASCQCVRDPFCGDGVVDPGEACDDGGLNGECGWCTTDCAGVLIC